MVNRVYSINCILNIVCEKSKEFAFATKIWLTRIVELGQSMRYDIVRYRQFGYANGKCVYRISGLYCFSFGQGVGHKHTETDKYTSKLSVSREFEKNISCLFNQRASRPKMKYLIFSAFFYSFKCFPSNLWIFIRN